MKPMHVARGNKDKVFYLIGGTLRRLRETSIARRGHFTLEAHKDVLKGLGARIPALKTRERRKNTAIALVNVRHVDLGDERNLRRKLGVLRTAVNLQEVKTTLVTSTLGAKNGSIPVRKIHILIINKTPRKRGITELTLLTLLKLVKKNEVARNLNTGHCLFFSDGN